ncbi:hypothetical protein ACFYQT_40155 [Streptomyces tibetensis]|uniref:Uncharacterized protein n=1 Tax=Streptomyces tibetensis TaxID=2382123 RepID=A0ABW6N8K9_9ACTN
MSDQPQHTPEELAAIELAHGLKNLGPDTDRALMVTLRLPNCRYVEDVWLSKEDIQNLIDASIAISERQALEEAAEPLPLAEDDLTETDISSVVAGFEHLLGGE